MKTKHPFIVSIGALLTVHYSQVDGDRSFSSSSPRITRDTYYGTLIGKLESHHHDASGEVYAVDESTLFIRHFTYDGTGPDAYFWAGNSPRPDPSGFIIPDEKGSTKSLGAYRNKDLVLRLPEGKTFRDITWFSVWCRKFTVNFADLRIPRSLIIPTPVEIASFKTLAHDVASSAITIVDAQTFLIPDFTYDGEGPAAYFWASTGPSQSVKGTRLKDENGSDRPLRQYKKETIVISLPENKTIWDYDWFGVYCEEARADLGSTRIPQKVMVPPSPKMLGVKPESKLNCEVLYDDLGYELRWVMDGDDIVMQLVGRVDPGEYMSFGLGKDDSRSEMIRSDTVVAWIDHKSKRGHAVDYYLESKEACTGVAGTKSFKGACPDVKISASATDSLTLLHSSLVNGFSMVTFKRPQFGVDDIYDQHVYSDGQQSVNWAIGPLNDRNEVSFHRLHSVGNIFIDFARVPKWNCPSPDGGVEGSISSSSSPASAALVATTTVPPVAPSRAITPHSLSSLGAPTARPVTRNSQINSNSNSRSSPVSPASSSSAHSAGISTDLSGNNDAAWEIPAIICPSDRTFRAQIGPTGGKKGYQAITGKVGWGIAWYINGLLIPELVVQRGKTYTFIVEGGNDPVHSSRRHPFYITDNAEGGYDYRTNEERAQQKIFAGAILRTSDGQVVPTAQGRLCEWKMSPSSSNADSFADFFAFQRTLSLQCSPGKAAVIKWTPDTDTPDTVYYQCWTHRLLGWKIRVVDSCENLASASILSSVHQVPSLRNLTSTSASPSSSLVNGPVPSGSVNNPSVVKLTSASLASSAGAATSSKMHHVPTSQSLTSNGNSGGSHLTQSKGKKKSGNKKRKQQQPQQKQPEVTVTAVASEEATGVEKKKAHQSHGGRIESGGMSLGRPLIQQKQQQQQQQHQQQQQPAAVHFTIQPQIEAWMYQPAIYAAAYEAAVANPSPLSHTNGHHNPAVAAAGPTLDPFYMPSYSLVPSSSSSSSSDTQGEVVFHRIPPAISLPKAPVTFTQPPRPSLPPPPSSNHHQRVVMPQQASSSSYGLLHGASQPASHRQQQQQPSSGSSSSGSSNYVKATYKKNTRPRFSNKLQSNNGLQGGFMPMVVTAKPERNLISTSLDQGRNGSKSTASTSPSSSSSSLAPSTSVPLIEINRNSASDPSSSGKKHVPPANTVSSGVINKIKNMPPVPYQRPLEVHRYSSPPSTLLAAVTNESPSPLSSVSKASVSSSSSASSSPSSSFASIHHNRPSDSRAASSVIRPLHTSSDTVLAQSTSGASLSAGSARRKQQINKKLIKNPPSILKDLYYTVNTPTRVSSSNSPSTSHVVGSYSIASLVDSVARPDRTSSTLSTSTTLTPTTRARSNSVATSTSSSTSTMEPVYISSRYPSSSYASSPSSSPFTRLSASRGSPSKQSVEDVSLIEIPATDSNGEITTSASPVTTLPPSYMSSLSSSSSSSSYPSSNRTTQSSFTHSTSAAAVIITTPSPMELENDEVYTTAAATSNPTTVTPKYTDTHTDYYSNHQYTHVPSVQVLELKSKELVDALTNHKSTSNFYDKYNFSSTTAVDSMHTTDSPMTTFTGSDKDTLANKINYYYTVTTEATSSSRADATDDTENYTNHRLSYTRVNDAHRSTTPSDTGIAYNPIYYHDSIGDVNSTTGSSNASSTDHTILNHILSLIAVGESPPEVKVFTKANKKDDGNLVGAFSTHVEVHQRYPRRRRSVSSIETSSSSSSHSQEQAINSSPLTANTTNNSRSNVKNNLLSQSLILPSFIISLISFHALLF